MTSRRSRIQLRPNIRPVKDKPPDKVKEGTKNCDHPIVPLVDTVLNDSNSNDQSEIRTKQFMKTSSILSRWENVCSRPERKKLESLNDAITEVPDELSSLPAGGIESLKKDKIIVKYKCDDLVSNSGDPLKNLDNRGDSECMHPSKKSKIENRLTSFKNFQDKVPAKNLDSKYKGRNKEYKTPCTIVNATGNSSELSNGNSSSECHSHDTVLPYPMSSSVPDLNKNTENPESPVAVKKNNTKNGKEVCNKKKNNKQHNSDQCKMTMLDFIYWNNHAENSTQSTEKERNVLKEKVTGKEYEISDKSMYSVRNETVTDRSAEVDSSNENNVLIPRVMIDANGEITIDENSLVVQKQVEEIGLVQSDAISEKGNKETTYSSFRRRTAVRAWSEKETAKFFKVLGMLGTDFSLMSQYFPNRTRRALKLKFKREERRNFTLVDTTLKNPAVLDFALIESYAEDEMDEELKERTSDSKKKFNKRKQMSKADVEDIEVNSGNNSIGEEEQKKQQRARGLLENPPVSSLGQKAQDNKNLEVVVTVEKLPSEIERACYLDHSCHVSSLCRETGGNENMDMNNPFELYCADSEHCNARNSEKRCSAQVVKLHSLSHSLETARDHLLEYRPVSSLTQKAEDNKNREIYVTFRKLPSAFKNGCSIDKTDENMCSSADVESYVYNVSTNELRKVETTSGNKADPKSCNAENSKKKCSAQAVKVPFLSNSLETERACYLDHSCRHVSSLCRETGGNENMDMNDPFELHCEPCNAKNSERRCSAQAVKLHSLSHSLETARDHLLEYHPVSLLRQKEEDNKNQEIYVTFRKLPSAFNIGCNIDATDENICCSVDVDSYIYDVSANELRKVETTSKNKADPKPCNAKNSEKKCSAQVENVPSLSNTLGTERAFSLDHSRHNVSSLCRETEGNENIDMNVRLDLRCEASRACLLESPAVSSLIQKAEDNENTEINVTFQKLMPAVNIGCKIDETNENICYTADVQSYIYNVSPHEFRKVQTTNENEDSEVTLLSKENNCGSKKFSCGVEPVNVINDTKSDNLKNKVNTLCIRSEPNYVSKYNSWIESFHRQKCSPSVDVSLKNATEKNDITLPITSPGLIIIGPNEKKLLFPKSFILSSAK